MPLTPGAEYRIPDYWHVWGHSYVAGAVGSIDQTGRVDSILRGALDTEANNFQNHAVSGSRITMKGRREAGWTRVFQERVPSLTRGFPYAPDGGASLFFWGINDLGTVGVTQQVRDAYKHTLRACISRSRASTIWEDSNAKHAYGAGFTNLNGTEDIGSGTSLRQATTTTNATITLTLPADYDGSPLVMCFLGTAGVTGGTVTFSGTAGVTGTLSTSNIMPSATLSQCPVIKRVTNLTAANAGQTVIATVTQIDGSGTVFFDCSWLEAKSPPAVLVCNVNRLTASGYAFYGGWAGTEGQKDQNVLDFNTDIVSVASEFDAMVQVVDIDVLIGKNTTLTIDGIHPNESGAALIVDAILAAVRQLRPTSPLGATANMNVPAPRSGQRLRPRRSTHWYTSDARQAGTAYTPVAQDMWAIPFEVTGSRERYNRMCVETTAAGSAAGTIRWGIYDDLGYAGYPQVLQVELTSAGAFTVTTGTGSKQCPASGTGSLLWIPDPGQYWLVVKIITTGTGLTYRTLAGPSMQMPNMATTGTMATLASGWKHTSQGTTALPNTYPTAGATLSDNAMMIGLQLV